MNNTIGYLKKSNQSAKIKEAFAVIREKIEKDKISYLDLSMSNAQKLVARTCDHLTKIEQKELMTMLLDYEFFEENKSK